SLEVSGERRRGAVTSHDVRQDGRSVGITTLLGQLQSACQSLLGPGARLGRLLIRLALLLLLLLLLLLQELLQPGRGLLQVLLAPGAARIHPQGFFIMRDGFAQVGDRAL